MVSAKGHKSGGGGVVHTMRIFIMGRQVSAGCLVDVQEMNNVEIQGGWCGP